MRKETLSKATLATILALLATVVLWQTDRWWQMSGPSRYALLILLLSVWLLGLFVALSFLVHVKFSVARDPLSITLEEGQLNLSAATLVVPVVWFLILGIFLVPRGVAVPPPDGIGQSSPTPRSAATKLTHIIAAGESWASIADHYRSQFGQAGVPESECLTSASLAEDNGASETDLAFGGDPLLIVAPHCSQGGPPPPYVELIFKALQNGVRAPTEENLTLLDDLTLAGARSQLRKLAVEGNGSYASPFVCFEIRLGAVSIEALPTGQNQATVATTWRYVGRSQTSRLHRIFTLTLDATSGLPLLTNIDVQSGEVRPLDSPACGTGATKN